MSELDGSNNEKVETPSTLESTEEKNTNDGGKASEESLDDLKKESEQSTLETGNDAEETEEVDKQEDSNEPDSGIEANQNFQQDDTEPTLNNLNETNLETQSASVNEHGNEDTEKEPVPVEEETPTLKNGDIDADSDDANMPEDSPEDRSDASGTESLDAKEKSDESIPKSEEDINEGREQNNADDANDKQSDPEEQQDSKESKDREVEDQTDDDIDDQDDNYEGKPEDYSDEDELETSKTNAAETDNNRSGETQPNDGENADGQNHVDSLDSDNAIEDDSVVDPADESDNTEAVADQPEEADDARADMDSIDESSEAKAENLEDTEASEVKAKNPEDTEDSDVEDKKPEDEEAFEAEAENPEDAENYEAKAENLEDDEASEAEDKNPVDVKDENPDGEDEFEMESENLEDTENSDIEAENQKDEEASEVESEHPEDTEDSEVEGENQKDEEEFEAKAENPEGIEVNDENPEDTENSEVEDKNPEDDETSEAKEKNSETADDARPEDFVAKDYSASNFSGGNNETREISDQLGESLEPFEQSNWDSIDLNQRKEAIENLRDSVASDLDLKNPPDVKYYDNPDDGDFGGYSPSENAIYINEHNMGDAAETADTIAHESRHCWQHECAENPDDPKGREFKENFDDYVRPEDDYRGYRDQPVEVDAREYAKDITDNIPDAHNEYPDNNKSYETSPSNFERDDIRQNEEEKGTVFDENYRPSDIENKANHFESKVKTPEYYSSKFEHDTQQILENYYKESDGKLSDSQKNELVSTLKQSYDSAEKNDRGDVLVPENSKDVTGIYYNGKTEKYDVAYDWKPVDTVPESRKMEVLHEGQQFDRVGPPSGRCTGAVGEDGSCATIKERSVPYHFTEEDITKEPSYHRYIAEQDFTKENLSNAIDNSMYTDEKKAEMHQNLDRYYSNAISNGYGDGDGLASGKIAPMFEDTTGSTGGGKQFDMPFSMDELEDIGMISEVSKGTY